ncbi:hypothetical protein HUO13_32730 [Saccharopolyspora erythraea]|uniref:hypothetical protein n=1 Tax=Saccharopolyspora erythraea TaxID=1836 RepID=UPI001BA9A13D|nr:hypothetical protein [Saccharopolyspora erythraea]QUH04911.1 hypothetical protein HUO13_32730 [Saccharopolyspora erythraea]
MRVRSLILAMLATAGLAVMGAAPASAVVGPFGDLLGGVGKGSPVSSLLGGGK